MAQRVGRNTRIIHKKRTGIGHSTRSRPNNKHKRRCWKKYHRQGK